MARLRRWVSSTRSPLSYAPGDRSAPEQGPIGRSLVQGGIASLRTFNTHPGFRCDLYYIENPIAGQGLGHEPVRRAGVVARDGRRQAANLGTPALYARPPRPRHCSTKPRGQGARRPIVASRGKTAKSTATAVNARSRSRFCRSCRNRAHGIRTTPLCTMAGKRFPRAEAQGPRPCVDRTFLPLQTADGIHPSVLARRSWKGCWRRRATVQFSNVTSL